MTPNQDSTLLHKLAKQAKKARQEGTPLDNEAVIRRHNRRNAGASYLFAVVLAIIMIIAILNLVL